MAQHGGPDSENLVGERTTLCGVCRVLMRRGIFGPFETWQPSIPTPVSEATLRAADLCVCEPDDAWRRSRLKKGLSYKLEDRLDTNLDVIGRAHRSMLRRSRLAVSVR
jgi:hypothetical protein